MTRALDLVSLGYVMDRLGLSKAHVLSLVKAGAIPSHQIRPGPTGRTMWVFEAKDVEQVEQRRRYMHVDAVNFSKLKALAASSGSKQGVSSTGRVRQQRSRKVKNTTESIRLVDYSALYGRDEAKVARRRWQQRSWRAR